MYFRKDEKAVLHLDLGDPPGSDLQDLGSSVCAAGTSDTSSLHSEIHQLLYDLSPQHQLLLGVFLSTHCIILSSAEAL